MTATALRFQIGARTLFSVRRRLVRVGLGLDEALSGALPALPPLGDGDGHLITSLPEAALPRLSVDGSLVHVRQRYTRYWVDLAAGHDAWWAGLSANTRSSLKRKAKRLGAAEVVAYRTPDELARFHDVAADLAGRTYQAKLLDAALPTSDRFRAEMLADAAADRVRAWTLAVDERPIAYLYCPAVGNTLIYAYVGHDPDAADLSPGTVLQLHALRDLFAEARFARFDFTEGEGQHKRGLASGGVACVDMLLLRPTLANRATIAALAGFDRGVALAKRMMGTGGLAKRVRRGA